MRERLGSTALSALQQEWDAKLAASGFVDLEKRSDGGRLDAHMKLPGHVDDDPDAREYYLRAAHLLNEPGGPIGRAREVWILHADGVSNKEIATRLRARRQDVTDAVDYWRSKLLGGSGYQGDSGYIAKVAPTASYEWKSLSKKAGRNLVVGILLAVAKIQKCPKGPTPKRFYPEHLALLASTSPASRPRYSTTVAKLNPSPQTTPRHLRPSSAHSAASAKTTTKKTSLTRSTPKTSFETSPRSLASMPSESL